MPPLITRDNTCCFSGHRPEKLPWHSDELDPRCVKLKEKLYDVVQALYLSGIRHFICGMARGCDFYFAETVLRLRSDYEGITLEAAIPCEEQSKNWSESDRSRYYHLVSECDFETLLQREYTEDCMLRRNKYMVDRSSVLIAVFDGTLGGTLHTVNYASKKELEIIEIRP